MIIWYHKEMVSCLYLHLSATVRNPPVTRGDTAPSSITLMSSTFLSASFLPFPPSKLVSFFFLPSSSFPCFLLSSKLVAFLRKKGRKQATRKSASCFLSKLLFLMVYRHITQLTIAEKPGEGTGTHWI